MLVSQPPWTSAWHCTVWLTAVLLAPVPVYVIRPIDDKSIHQQPGSEPLCVTHPFPLLADCTWQESANRELTCIHQEVLRELLAGK